MKCKRTRKYIVISFYWWITEVGLKHVVLPEKWGNIINYSCSKKKKVHAAEKRVGGRQI